MHWLSLVAIVAVVGMASTATTGKVLMIPSSLYPTHRWVMRELAGELVKRGHKVVWWEYGLAKSSIELPKGVEERFWKLSVKDQTVNDLFLHKNHSSFGDVWNADFKETATQAAGWLASIKLCEQVLTTRKGDFDLLVKEKFDTVVVDDLYNPCGLLHVGLQKNVFIYWSMTALRTESAWANQSPSPPSYIPVPGTGLTDELDFWQRSFNLASYLKAIYIHQRIVLRRVDALFQRFYPGVTESFYIERNASINYVNTPPIFDFARPYMPRVNFVGGVQCHKPKPLAGNVAKFVESADNEHGFILFTTGFSVQWKYAPKTILDAFSAAFKARSDVKFIWQYDGPAIPNLPPNVLIEKWLPQQDLLGHPKCKGLISHGGLNSVIESIWHGVPIIGLPLTSQGRDNLLRATARGAGFMLNKEHINDKTILKAIRKIYDKEYKQEVLIFQDLITDVPYTELNHSAFWVEFIMRHQEVPHARSGADHLNILQYFLVDVLSFMFAVVFLFFTVLYYVIKFTCKGCCYVCRASYRSIAGGSAKVKVDKKKKTQ